MAPQTDDRETRLGRRARRIRQGARRYLIVWLTVAALALLAQAVAPAETPASRTPTMETSVVKAPPSKPPHTVHVAATGTTR